MTKMGQEVGRTSDQSQNSINKIDRVSNSEIDD